MLSTAVVFIIFNRPDSTLRVFETIREARPSMLYLIADGPRNEKESVLTDATRVVVKKVDWPCEVIEIYSEVNLGCRNRIITGLDEVFACEDSAIILEDDCLPHLDFFDYCEQLLNKYRNNVSIMHIAGSCFLPYRTDFSYYFSKYTFVWGWATWARAWKLLKPNINEWNVFESENITQRMIDSPRERVFWKQVFEDSFKNNLNAWSYLWTYTCWKAKGVSIVPTSNLVSNIGFGPDGTHTKAFNPLLAEKPVFAILQLNHPESLEIDKRNDEWVSGNIYDPERKSQPIKNLVYHLKKVIKKVFYGS